MTSRPRLSESNPAQARQALQQLYNDVTDDGPLCGLGEASVRCSISLPPTLSVLNESLLVDREALDTLTANKLINWCRTSTTRVFPLHNVTAASVTTSSADSLLRATSISLWGLDDVDTVSFLRRLLHVAMTTSAPTANTAQLVRRWHLERSIILGAHRPAAATGDDDDVGIYQQYGASSLSSNDMQDVDEACVRQSAAWKELCDVCADHLDSTSHQSSASCALSLQPIHVFVMSNVLRRPIIILPGSRHPPSSGTSDLSGIYLPVLHDPAVCVRTPIPLIQSPRHPEVLLPLVLRSSDDGSPPRDAVLPLVGSDLVPLVVRCLLPVDGEQPERVLPRYLVVAELPSTSSTGLHTIAVARLEVVRPATDMLAAFIASNSSSGDGSASRQTTQQQQQLSESRIASSQPTSLPSYSLAVTQPSAAASASMMRSVAATGPASDCHKCTGVAGCSFYGRPETDWKCSSCYKLQQQTQLHATFQPPNNNNIVVLPHPARLASPDRRPLLLQPAPVTNILEGLSLGSAVAYMCSAPSCSQPIATGFSDQYCVDHCVTASSSADYHTDPPRYTARPADTSGLQYSTTPPPYVATIASPEVVAVGGMSAGQQLQQPRQCRVVGCQLYGLPELSGYCSQHHNIQLQSKQTQTVFPSCVNAACDGAGVASYGGVCVHCYITNNVPASSSSRPAAAEAKLSTQRSQAAEPSCIMDFCGNVGCVECKGLCRQCFSVLCQGRVSDCCDTMSASHTSSHLLPPPPTAAAASAPGSLTSSSLHAVNGVLECGGQERCIMEGCRSPAVVDNTFCQNCFNKQQEALLDLKSKPLLH